MRHAFAPIDDRAGNRTNRLATSDRVATRVRARNQRPGRSRYLTACRPGFTLVELLVAMALIMFVMAILASAFGVIGKTFSDLKAVGDLNEKLRTASRVLRADLAAVHFTDNNFVVKKLSDPNFWTNGPPTDGFFRVWNQVQATPLPAAPGGTSFEGLDLDGIPSYLTTGHALHFTVALPVVASGKPLAPPQKPSDVFRALIGDASAVNTLGGTIPCGSFTYYYDGRFQTKATSAPFIYTSQWAEVAYFIRALSGEQTAEGSPPTQLYGLYRRQKLAVPPACDNQSPDASAIAGPAVPAGYDPQISTFGGDGNNCNTPLQLTVPQRRFDMDWATAGSQYYPRGADPVTSASPVYEILQDGASTSGTTTPPETTGTPNADDLLLNDVISFDVRLLAWEIIDGILTPPGPSDPNARFLDLFDSDLPAGTRFFNNYVNNPYVVTPPKPDAYLKVVPAGDRPFNDAGKPRVFDTWSQVQGPIVAGAVPPSPNADNFASWTPGTGTVPPPPATTSAADHTRIPLYQYTDGTGAGRIHTLSIRAVQIVIRVWDFKSEKTRQVTIVQDL